MRIAYNLQKLQAFKKLEDWSCETWPESQPVLRIWHTDVEGNQQPLYTIFANSEELDFDVISQFEFDKKFSLEKS